jgi:myxalamid-type polyketide synthase MxaE and MxaD
LTREALLARDPSEQHAVLLDYIRATTARILQLKPEEIDPDTPITGMFDSLMTIELRNRIETDLKVSLPLSDMFQDLTIALICDRVRALLGAASAAPRGLAPVPRESRRAPDAPGSSYTA